MAYGSSPIFGLNYTGITGPTGLSGPVGIRGAIGPTGSVRSGPTGPSITGMTLNSSGFVSTLFSDGQRFDAVSKLIGATGNYYIPADADVLSSTFNFVKGVSYYVNDGDSIQNVIHLRGLTTNSSDVIRINTDTSGNVNIDYSIFNVAYLGISGGSIGQLVYNKPGDKQAGLTGTNYTTDNNSATAQIANYSERISIINPILKSTASGVGFYYWKIDSDTANIFKLNPWTSDPSASGTDVVAQMLYIKSPQNESVSKGITIIIPNGVTASNTLTTLYATTEDLAVEPDIETFEENISWPLTIPPCFTQNVDILNLISIGDVWHASFSHLGFTFGVNGDVVGEVDKAPTLLPLTEEMFNCARGNNIIGLCCPSNCLLNPYETIEVLCNGIFFPGITLTDPCYVCDDVGVCCVTQSDGTIIKLPSFVRDCECSAFANGLVYNWIIKDDSITTPNDVNCGNAQNQIGACCDGSGNCTEQTQTNCVNAGGSYQGDGVLCSTAGGNRCAAGTGACCNKTTGLCTDNQTSAECNASGGSYRGSATTCASQTCVSTCFAPVFNSVELTPGTEFEGGIVVGVFNPKNALCSGNTAFGGIPTSLLNGTNIEKFNFLTNGDERTIQDYFSKYSLLGYGFDTTSTHNCAEDSWLLIVSKFPVIITENPNLGQFIKQNFDTSTGQIVSKFTWSHGGTYFGWIMNEQGQIPSTLITGEELVLDDPTKDEGFYTFKVGTNGITYLGNEYSFSSCLNTNENTRPVNRSGTGLNYGRITFNGKWHPNWGLYNTIRMTCAERHAYDLDPGYDINLCNCDYTQLYGFNPQSGFTSFYNDTNWQGSSQSSAEAISAVNHDYFSSTNIIPSLSDWYLPSADELAFILKNIQSVNSDIIFESGIPIGDPQIGANGWVWSSTGTFNEANLNEYQQTVSTELPVNPDISTHNPVNHGTEAWAMQVDLANFANSKIAKQNRMNKYEVRPVRMVRCDRRFYEPADEIRYWRFWKIPKLPQTTIVGTRIDSGGGGGPGGGVPV